MTNPGLIKGYGRGLMTPEDLAADRTFTGRYRKLAPASIRLVALGDSIPAASESAVQKRDTYNHWASVLTGNAVWYVRNAGIGGNSTTAMLARFDRDVTPYNPGIVTCNGGVNDYFTGVSDAHYRNNIAKLVTAIRAINAVPVILGPTSYTGGSAGQKAYLARNSAWCAEWCAANGVLFVDMMNVMVDPTTDGNTQAALSSDGLHPNDYGHYLIGKELAKVLSVYYTPRRTLAYYTSDPANLTPNGFMQGGTTTSTNWASATGNITAGTASFSVTADANVPGGSVQRISLSSATGVAQVRTNPNITTGWSIGDKMRLSVMVTAAGAGARIACMFVGPYTLYSASLLAADFTRGELTTSDFIIPTGTTALQINLEANDRGGVATTGYVDFTAVTLRNLSKSVTAVVD